MRDFRLDRMEAVDDLGETFDGHEDFSLMDFIHTDMEEAELTPVTLTCAPWVRDRFVAELPAQLVSQRPLPNGHIKIHALTCSLDWLTGWLLGFGTSAVAKGPAALLEKVGQEARDLAALYEKSALTEAS